MTIAENIRNDLKEAMRAKNETSLLALRAVLSGFTNELVASGKTPQDTATDELALKVLQKEAKKRKDSILQFTSGQRPDLAEKEQAELSVIEKYLPQMMSREEIKKIAEQKIKEIGNDKTKIGVITGAVMKETAGLADGKDVKEIISELIG